MSSVLVRSTLIATSRHGLFKLGHEERYVAVLGAEREARMREVTMAAQWLDIEVALDHYRAADALGLSVIEMHRVGNVVGERLEGALWGSFARIARSGGLTPWTVLQRLDRIWGRMYKGDTITVTKAGPKDAIIDIGGNALADVDYWRVALVGLMRGATELFSRSAYVTLEAQTAPKTAQYRVAWA